MDTTSICIRFLNYIFHSTTNCNSVCRKRTDNNVSQHAQLEILPKVQLGVTLENGKLADVTTSQAILLLVIQVVKVSEINKWQRCCLLMLDTDGDIITMCSIHAIRQMSMLRPCTSRIRSDRPTFVVFYQYKKN